MHGSQATIGAIGNQWLDNVTSWIVKYTAMAVSLAFVYFITMMWVLPTFGSWAKAGTH